MAQSTHSWAVSLVTVFTAPNCAWHLVFQTCPACEKYLHLQNIFWYVFVGLICCCVCACLVVSFVVLGLLLSLCLLWFKQRDAWRDEHIHVSNCGKMVQFSSSMCRIWWWHEPAVRAPLKLMATVKISQRIVAYWLHIESILHCIFCAFYTCWFTPLSTPFHLHTMEAESAAASSSSPPTSTSTAPICRACTVQVAPRAQPGLKPELVQKLLRNFCCSMCFVKTVDYALWEELKLPNHGWKCQFHVQLEARKKQEAQQVQALTQGVHDMDIDGDGKEGWIRMTCWWLPMHWERKWSAIDLGGQEL